MPLNAIAWSDNKLIIIDQTRLPGKLEKIKLQTLEEIEEAIRKLKVRGAPAIGIAAAYGAYVAISGLHYTDLDDFRLKSINVIERLNATRPTAVNLSWALKQIREIIDTGFDPEKIKEGILKLAIDIHEDDRQRCHMLGEYGSQLIPSGSKILTHCNTGILATGGKGTALSGIYTAWEKHRNIRVYADETRPLLQGSRLTAWELMENNVPVTLIADNMAAWLMQNKKIDLVIVGADRIAANGDAANKIGTYSVAVIAKYHDIPFYVAAPLSTFDLSIQSGKDIVIEERDPEEVRRFGKSYSAPENVDVYNPAFDVTPAELITAIVTEKGIIKNKDFNQIAKILT